MPSKQRPSRPGHHGAPQRSRPDAPPRERPPAACARPLYDKAAQASLAGTGNRGLWYDKFCDRWKPDWTDIAGDSGKREWIATIANIETGASSKKVGDAALLTEAGARLEGLVSALKGTSFKRTTAWRFVTGLGRSHPVENGFAWRHDLGTPYLPGSSLKGLARAYARDWEQLPDEHLHRIFGPEPEADLAVGGAVFLDALPVEPVVLEADVMTPHYSPWYQNEKGAVPGDWHSPTPIPFLAVAPGQTFIFAVLPRNPSSAEDLEHCKTAAGLLRQALETLGAGAKTAVGYGQFVQQQDGQQPKVNRGAATGAAAARHAGGRETWTGREAIVDDEVVRIIEDRGKTLLVRFYSGEEEERDRSEARLR